MDNQVFVLFSTTNHLFSWLIRLMTWGKYSHVEIYNPKNHRLVSADALQGVIEVRLNERIKKSTDNIALYKVEVPKPDDVIGWLTLQLGKKYDWSAIFGFLFRHNWQEDNKWFCSELTLAALRHGGARMLNTTDLYKVSPRDLLLSPDLQLVAKGKDKVVAAITSYLESLQKQ